MTKLYAFLSIVLVALVVSATALASGYTDGYVNDEGYRYNAQHDLWWKDGYFWERYKENAYRYETRHDGCCRTYQVKVPYAVWKYRRAAIRDIVTEKDPDMHIKFLDLLMARDKGVLAERELVVKTQQFHEMLKSTGLYQNFRVDGYGEFLGYGNYDPLLQDSGYDEVLAPQGATQYGFSGFNESHTVSRGVDLDQWRARRQQLQETNAAYAAADVERLDATVENIAASHSEIVAAKAANQELRATISEMRGVVTELARLRQVMGQAGKDIQTHQRSGWQAIPKASPAPLVNPQSAIPVPDDVMGIFTAHCGTCHGGGAAEGEFELSALDGLNFEGRKYVWSLIREKKMPKKLESEDQPRWLSADDQDRVADWVWGR